MKGDLITLFSQASSDWWRGCVGGREGLIPDKYILIKIRGEDDARDSLSCVSDTSGDGRRRISSDTLRSSRSESGQSPRVSRVTGHTSVSAPPETPPLSRSAPHRNSVNTAPVTVISVTSSHDSLEQDSGHPESDHSVGHQDSGHSERGNSRSPSEYRSLECDSLSVDDTNEAVSDDNTGGAGATVIHVTGGEVFTADNIPNIDDDDDLSNRRTLQTEVSQHCSSN